MKEKILVKIVVETDVSLGQHQLDVWLAEVLELQYIGKVPLLCTCNVQDAMVLDQLLKIHANNAKPQELKYRKFPNKYKYQQAYLMDRE